MSPGHGPLCQDFLIGLPIGGAVIVEGERVAAACLDGDLDLAGEARELPRP